MLFVPDFIAKGNNDKFALYPWPNSAAAIAKMNLDGVAYFSFGHLAVSRSHETLLWRAEEIAMLRAITLPQSSCSWPLTAAAGMAMLFEEVEEWCLERSIIHAHVFSEVYVRK